MNYVNFLKQINNLDDGKWTADVSRERDFALIKNDIGIAIKIIKEDNGKVECELHELRGASNNKLDLIIQFVQGNDQLDVKEQNADTAEEYGLIKQFDTAADIAINFVKEQLLGSPFGD